MTVQELRDKLAVMPDMNATVSLIVNGETVAITDALNGGTAFGVILEVKEE